MMTTRPAMMTTDAAPSTGLGGVAEPQMLPLPFDDGTDESVPFVLTAAAHREVLGRDVPPLVAVTPPQDRAPSVTPGPVGDEDDASEMRPDTRRAQARALLRSGMPSATIAAALGVGTDQVDRWTADLGDELARRRRAVRRPVRREPPAAPSAPPVAAVAPEASAPFLPGLALALAEVDEDAVTIVHDRIEPVALLVDALRAHGDVDRTRLRVAVRLTSDLPADRMRAELAERLGVDAATITVGRSTAAMRSGLELRVDVRDEVAARLVRAWRDGVGGADREDRVGTSGLRGWDSNPQTFRLTADCSAS
jgi:hypothetical protein